MFVIPVKTNRENPAISPLFGKAKYFAFVDKEEIKIEENPFDNGAELIEWFIQKGVNDIIIEEMGNSPYQKIKNLNLNIYFAGEGRVLLSEIVEKYNSKTIELLSEDKIIKIISKHENRHNHDNHSHH